MSAIPFKASPEVTAEPSEGAWACPSQIVFVGFGMVGRSILSVLRRKEPGWTHVPVLIFDPRDLSSCKVISDARTHSDMDITVVGVALSETNCSLLFESRVLPGAMVFEVAWRVSTRDLLIECERRDCFYINTALDHWVGRRQDWTAGDMVATSLVSWKRQLVAGLSRPGRRTAILNHGMNPGLVSHLVKYALSRLYQQEGRERCCAPPNTGAEGVNASPTYSQMAQALGLTSVIISERDTQKTRLQTTERCFLNTWSVVGFFDEAIDPVQLSWGTHERLMPKLANTDLLHSDAQIVLPIRGNQLRARSFEPAGGLLTGYVVPHAECYSIADFLREGDHYRPSCYYCYQIPDIAKVAAHYMDRAAQEPEFGYHVVESGDITDGYDSVGALLCLRGSGSGIAGKSSMRKFWIGSILDNEEAKGIHREVNATCIQVAISVLAAARWSLQHPFAGICEPEQLDSEFIVDYAKEYLGKFVFSECTAETASLSDEFRDLLVCPRPEAFEWIEGSSSRDRSSFAPPL